MNNLISKSKPLFLVAILAIFPSANAMSEVDALTIKNQIQEIYTPFKEQLVEQIQTYFNNELVLANNKYSIVEQEFLKLSNRVLNLEQAQVGNHQINMGMPEFNQIQPHYQGEQMIVDELNHVAANTMNFNDFNDIITNYLNEYKVADASTRATLTKKFKDKIANKINGTGLTTIKQVKDGAQIYIGEDILSPKTTTAINEFLARR